jgi:miniconductance mechanosensitive channel
MNPELWVEDVLISNGVGLETTQYLVVAIGSILLLGVCLIGNYVTKKFIVQGIQNFIEKSNNSWDDIFLEKEVFH